MKLALVFDDLIQMGGAESLLLAAHEIWPNAPIFTTVASKKWQKICKDRGIDLRTSILQKFPFSVRLHRVYAALFFHILALRRFDFSKYDVVLSMSSRFAHMIKVVKPTKHICYMNSPGRMFWEPHFYFKEEKFGKLLHLLLSLPLSVMRVFDYFTSQNVDYFISNSNTPKLRIKKYYNRRSKVIYPFVKVLVPKTRNSQNSQNLKYSDGKATRTGDSHKNYFLILTRLVSWKRVDIAIKACTSLNIPLKIAGTGPALKTLKKIANTSASLDSNVSNIEFLGYVSENKKADLLAGCKALIITQKEDFGIAPLEALAHGRPVIAYKKGGVLETITAGITGTFYNEQTEESLTKVLKDFNASMFDSKKCKEHSEHFTKEKFQTKLKKFVSDVYLKSNV